MVAVAIVIISLLAITISFSFADFFQILLLYMHLFLSLNDKKWFILFECLHNLLFKNLRTKIVFNRNGE